MPQLVPPPPSVSIHVPTAAIAAEMPVTTGGSFLVNNDSITGVSGTQSAVRKAFRVGVVRDSARDCNTEPVARSVPTTRAPGMWRLNASARLLYTHASVRQPTVKRSAWKSCVVVSEWVVCPLLHDLSLLTHQRAGVFKTALGHHKGHARQHPGK